MKKRAVMFRDMKCSECDYMIPVPKSLYKMTSNGHVKHMWCAFCKKETEFIQVGSFRTRIY